MDTLTMTMFGAVLSVLTVCVMYIYLNQHEENNVQTLNPDYIYGRCTYNGRVIQQPTCDSSEGKYLNGK